MADRDSFYRDVGLKVRTRRLQRKLSQDSLATSIGLTRSSVTNIEKGRQKLLLHTFYDLARVLEVDPASLLPEHPMPEPISRKRLASLSEEERAFIESAIAGKAKE